MLRNAGPTCRETLAFLARNTHSLAGEALPPPSDISPGSRAEWDFNPPERVSCQAHTMQSSDSSTLPRQLRLLGFLPWPGTALAIAGETRSPRFRRDPFVRDVAIDPGGASAPRV